jgi:hypothetical protein
LGIASYNYIYNNSTTPYVGTAIRRVVLDYSGESANYLDILIGDLLDSNRVVIGQHWTASYTVAKSIARLLGFATYNHYHYNV